MDRLLDWLPAHLPANDETVLVHGDYRLDNMMFQPSEPRVLGIIDWEISTLGDPLAELSYLCMLWRTPKDWGGLEGHDLAAVGLPTEQEMVAYYCELSKRALPDPALWEFYMAYNLFRVSCIRQGVYARALDGTAANIRAAESGKLVRPAAELPWKIVDGMAGGARCPSSASRHGRGRPGRPCPDPAPGPHSGSWAARVQHAAPAAAGAGAPSATDWSASWPRASRAGCSIRRRSTAAATSRRWPWRCSTSAPMSPCGTVPAAT